MGKISDFFVDLKVKGDTITLKDMVARMSDLKLTTLGEITALGVLGDMLKNTALHAMDMASNYTTLSKELGINTDLLQKWQNVARSSNVPIEAVASSFANVQKTLAGSKMGQFNEGFMRGAAFLGVPNAAAMSYDQIFETLRAKVPDMIKSRGRAFTSNALSLMGIDPSMIQMFELNRKQFGSRENATPIINQEQLKQWTEMNNQIAILKQNLFILSEEVLTPLLPKLIDLAKIAEIMFRIPTGKEMEQHPILKGMKQFSDLGDYANRAGLSTRAFIAGAAPRVAATARTVVQNIKTDFHIVGGNAEAIAKETKRHLDRQQRDLTTALQATNSQWAQ